MSKLSWISDNKFSEFTKILIEQSNNANEKAIERIKRNVRDPFSSLVMASIMSVKSADTLMKMQENASAMSGISSAIGKFHQNILGAIAGWENHDAGYDLVNNKMRMVVEVKNKHNTTNADSWSNILENIDTAVRQKGSGWTGYIVEIVPIRPIRFETRLNTQRPVYKIDGASFYAKVTGHGRAIHDLFAALLLMLESEAERQVPEDVKKYCQNVLRGSIPQ